MKQSGSDQIFIFQIRNNLFRTLKTGFGKGLQFGRRIRCQLSSSAEVEAAPNALILSTFQFRTSLASQKPRAAARETVSEQRCDCVNSRSDVAVSNWSIWLETSFSYWWKSDNLLSRWKLVSYIRRWVLDPLHLNIDTNLPTIL